MKRVLIYSLYKDDDIQRVRDAVKRSGFVLAAKNPQMVICMGGDGTLLRAERSFPGVPKLMVRKSEVCKKCVNGSLQSILMKAQKKELFVKKYDKVEVIVKGKRMVAMNEISVRNKDPRNALRFTLQTSRKHGIGIIIGDGVVVATPFGSTGYFHSITRRSFKSGLGIALNNATKEIKPMMVNKDTKVVVTIKRGDAHVCADNNPQMLTIKQGEKATIKKAQGVARVVMV